LEKNQCLSDSPRMESGPRITTEKIKLVREFSTIKQPVFGLNQINELLNGDYFHLFSVFLQQLSTLQLHKLLSRSSICDGGWM
jgi:hypothetical protein